MTALKRGNGSYVPPEWSRIPTGGWRQDASCAQPHVDPRWFDDHTDSDGYGQVGAARRQARHELARRVCAGCPVRASCAADIDLRFDEGMRAGVDLRRLRGRAA